MSEAGYVLLKNEVKSVIDAFRNDIIEDLKKGTSRNWSIERVICHLETALLVVEESECEKEIA